jgi:hypothetical protein
MSITRLLDNRAEKRKRLRRISSPGESSPKRAGLRRSTSAGETAAIGASSLLLPHQLGREEDLEGFREWKSDFDKGYEGLRRRMSLRADRHQERHQKLVEKEFGPDISEADLGRRALRESPDLDSALESARQVGPEAKLEYWQYFAQKGGAAAQKKLRYIGDDGDLHSLSDEQFEVLKQGDASITDLGPLNRHHIRPVSTSLEETPTDVSLLTDPNNIVVMTADAHRDLHNGGVTYSDAIQRGQLGSGPSTVRAEYRNVVEGNYEQRVEEAAEERAGVLGVALGLVAGSASAIIRYHQMRDKPQKRRALAAVSALAGRGLKLGSTGYVGLRAQDETRQLIADGASDAAQIGAEVGTDFSTDLIASGLGIEAAAAARSAIQLVQSVRQGRSVRTATERFGKSVAKVGAQEATFVLTGLATDVLTPIPEPNIQMAVTATRVTWRVVEKGYKYRENMLSRRECRDKRLSALRDEAQQDIKASYQ